MVERIQKGGGFARLHICGDTNRLIPYTLSTGTHILDVDSAVNMAEAATQLDTHQVLCGNLDPDVYKRQLMMLPTERVIFST